MFAKRTHGKEAMVSSKISPTVMDPSAILAFVLELHSGRSVDFQFRMMGTIVESGKTPA
jgi:hypothetical protein